MTDISFFVRRRQELARRMGQGIAVIPTAPEHTRNRDAQYPYRFDSTFYYLTGFDEPEAVLVLISGDSPSSILFCREKNIEREIWDGYRYGPEAARETFGFDAAYPIDTLAERLPELLADQPTLYFALGQDHDWDHTITDALNTVRDMARTGVSVPAEIRDIRVITDEMRLYKDAAEIATMRRAAQISAGAHRRAMQVARPGMMEYQVEAELMYEFIRHGARFPAYTSIVATGANACVLHYVSNYAQLKEGDLLLIDAGCELDGYASDITRTFPVTGRFSPVQKDVYELVLASQQAAIDLVRPGVAWNDPHEAAVRVLAQGLIDFGLLQGSLDSVIENGDYRRFYMHRTGHWLGLDVHDVGEYKQAGEWRPLAPNMVLTVEPGLYIRPADDIPEAFWNIGIRIEDDALVTDQGCDIITRDTPKTVAEIEAVMRQHG